MTKANAPNNSATVKDNAEKSDASEKPDNLKQATSYIEFLSKVFGLLTWQVIVLIAIVMFYSPLRQMADLLPTKFAKSLVS